MFGLTMPLETDSFAPLVATTTAADKQVGVMGHEVVDDADLRLFTGDLNHGSYCSCNEALQTLLWYGG